jgi:hypothetical protein
MPRYSTRGNNGDSGYNPPIPQSDVQDLELALNGKASASHNHSQNDVTNLQTDLSTKAEKRIIATAMESIQEGDPVMLDWVTGKARKPKRFHTFRHSYFLNGISGWSAQYPVRSLSLGDGRIVFFTVGASSVLAIFNANTNTWGTTTTVKAAVTSAKGLYWDASTQRLITTYVASSIHYYRTFSISGNTITAVNSEAQISTSTNSVEDGLCGDGEGTVFVSAVISSQGGVIAGTIEPVSGTITFGALANLTGSGVTIQVCFLNISGTKRVCAVYPSTHTMARLYSYAGTTLSTVTTQTVISEVQMNGTSIYGIVTDGISKVAIVRHSSNGGGADKMAFLVMFGVTANSITTGQIHYLDAIRTDSISLVYDPVTKYFILSHYSVQSGIIRCYAFDWINNTLMISQPMGRTALYQSTSTSYPFQAMCYDSSLDLIVYGMRAFTESAGNYYIFNNAYDERMFVMGLAISNANADSNVEIAVGGIIQFNSSIVGALYYVDNQGSISISRTNYQIGIGLPNNQLLLNIGREEIAP